MDNDDEQMGKHLLPLTFMSERLLPLIPAGLTVMQVLPTPDRLTIVARPLPRRHLRRCAPPRAGRASLDQDVDAVLAAVAGGRIGVWLDVVRTYDNATYKHCLLVAGLAAGFAAWLGVTSKGQRLITRAALVHDIGKASIPHAILNKAGPLKPEKVIVMRTHAAIGHDMLARQGGYDPQFLEIVRHHHECVDGSGYPDALDGAQVKTMTRLLTICDIYAALIERRPYKVQIPPREAFDILEGMWSKLDGGCFGRLMAW